MRTRHAATMLIACSLAGCAAAPTDHGAAAAAAPDGFTLRTAPAGAAIETSAGFRCTSPCQLPIGGGAYVTTVTLLGYKPVQIPVAAGQKPGAVDVKLVAQDPSAGAPNPLGSAAH